MPSRVARWATPASSPAARGRGASRIRTTAAPSSSSTASASREGVLTEGDEVAVSVESRRRQGLRQHHTGTHLLHAALRRVLGTHVGQAGSLVAPDHLRFDFSHGAGLKDSEVEQVEQLVNEQVQANVVVSPSEMDLQDALKSGAMALFGEKYGDRVRVIRIGDFSTELCGGIHLDATGQIGLFKVVNEGAVASGVRRIEAVAGEDALRHVGQQEAALRESASLLKIPPLELPKRLQKLLDEQKQLEKQLAHLEARLARSRAQELASSAVDVAGVPVIAARLDGLDPDGLRSVVDTLRERLPSGRDLSRCGRGRQGEPRRLRLEGPERPIPRGPARPGGREDRRRRWRWPARPGPGRRQGSREDRRGARRRAPLGGARRRRVAVGSERSSWVRGTR